MPIYRNTFAGLCFLVPGVLQAQGQEATISYESAGAPVSVILGEINKASGVKLTCNPGFENTPIIVRFDKAPLTEVKSKIAAALLAKWEESANESRLVSDSEAWQKLRLDASNEELVALKESLDKALEGLRKQGNWDAQQVEKMIEKERKERLKIFEDMRKNNANLDASKIFIQKSSTRSQTPASPALLQVLEKLTPSLLASIKPGTRVVFSSTPNRMQKGFGFPAQPIISTFVNAHNLLASTAKRGASDPDNITVRGGLDLNAKPISGALVKMLLVASRVSESSGISLELKFADANGNYVGSASRYLDVAGNSNAENSVVKLENSSPVNYSSISKELAKAFVEAKSGDGGHNNSYAIATDSGMFRINSGGPLPVDPLSKEAIAYLADPVTHDPQSTFLSEGLLAIAKENNVNLVACCPDSSVEVASISANKGDKSGDLLSRLQGAGCLATKDGNWLVIEPRDRLKMVQNQMNRLASRKLFSQVLGRGFARLHQLATFALNLGENTGDRSFALQMLRVVDPYVWQDFKMASDFQPNILKFLGTLPEKALEATSPELIFPVATATSTQKQYLEKVAYGNSAMGQIAGDGDMMMIGIYDGPKDAAPLPGLGDEPTEAMPNGIPADARVRIKFSEQEIVKALVKGRRGGQFLNAMALGGSMAFDEEGAANAQSGVKVAKFDSFMEAQGFHLNVYCEFTPNRTSESDYQDAWLGSNASVVTLEGLSKTFIEALERARASMKGTRLSFGQPAEPPPG